MQKKYKNNIQRLSQNAKIGFAASLIIWICVLYVQYIHGWRFSIAEYQIKKLCVGFVGAFAAINVIRVLSIQVDKTWLRKWMIQIGQATIWILCVHGIGIEIVSPFFYSLNNMNGMMLMFIRLILDILIALGLKKIWNHLK